ncbi:MAG: hypothetical protein LBK08_08700 [Treponema sp.]|jgi:hypothetical protein|nr:hypothetical protein [Treponema sp.]
MAKSGESIRGLEREFTALVGPVIGTGQAGKLFRKTAGRAASNGGPPFAPGAVAAFFLGEFDDKTMRLEEYDWEDIRETISEVSSEINMDTLAALMQELLSRGKLLKQGSL